MTEKAVVPNYTGEVVETPHYMSESVEAKVLVLEGIEIYADVITQYKNQMAELLKSGLLTEQTASQLVVESELSFFKQLVKVKYS